MHTAKHAKRLNRSNTWSYESGRCGQPIRVQKVSARILAICWKPASVVDFSGVTFEEESRFPVVIAGVQGELERVISLCTFFTGFFVNAICDYDRKPILGVAGVKPPANAV